MQTAIIISAAILLCLLLLIRRRTHGKETGLHKAKRRRARKLFNSLNKGPMDVPGTLARLRKTDPYVLEELIIIALRQKGLAASHGRRYSGDGGVDGEVTISGERYHIQVKRYKNHIKNSHVKEFVYKCRKDGCKGLFIHTGRTGKASRSTAKEDALVTIISGQKLVDLIDKTKDLKIR